MMDPLGRSRNKFHVYS